MKYGFFRVCSASPDVTVAQCKANADCIIKCIHKAAERGARLVVFPELCITSYTCADLFWQKALLNSAMEELFRIIKKTEKDGCISVLGLPFAENGFLYNCAAVVSGGKLLALVPKTFIPGGGEFYEERYFSSALKNAGETSVFINLAEIAQNGTSGSDKKNESGKTCEIPFTTDIIFKISGNDDFAMAVEISEDLWALTPPSSRHALLGANVIANPSAKSKIIGGSEYKKLLVSSHSARIAGAYVYSEAGHGESTQDAVFGSDNIICENGTILSESKAFEKNDENGALIFADIDLERLSQERSKASAFLQCEEASKFLSKSNSYKTVWINLPTPSKSDLKLERNIDPHPFIPADKDERAARCREVTDIQAEGLAKRIRHTKAEHAVIGLSGGLDSTLALLVTCKSFDMCGIARNKIKALTMPCFGTTDRTYENACALAKQTGADLKTIDIKDSVLKHLNDIGHSEDEHDSTYENAQARERTQVLMDIANMTGGLVIGTGDLSELALGWATYNGDHMSMYNVNGSIPKTLVRHLVTWFAEEALKNNEKRTAEVLKDILDTPVSPELLPPENGNIAQKTEDLVGPYELHDFFIYYMLRFGFSPAKIFFLAKQAFYGVYADKLILKWLKFFYKRFFSQQFKRSCMPDGPKVGTVGLSPRGDLKMPSDANAQIWLDELEKLK
ncbi:NAD(+) synthase [Treponema parvum]|uniref:Glutamine-dependent NAD(+) synthetase n=1 Tax=Treponema parvum TaxID=138851 RepID=A0A975IES0_9SPIR|nr:NAD(+) synthase [Treponema parvum]QTQ14251.1 NAD(+) synthase [Treponema parvum]